MNETRHAPTRFECAALLFDMDGVLVDSSEVIERSWMSWARRHGVDQERLSHLIHGRKALDVVRQVAPHLDAEAELAVLVRQEIEDEQGPTMFEGAKRLLDGLPGDRWAIVTSAPRVIATSRLAQLRLPLPRVLITAEDVSAGKPSPEGYLKAAAQLGMIAHDCVVVEDSLAGIEAALAASMRVLAVATTHVAAELTRATWRAPAVGAMAVDNADPLHVRLTALS